MACADPNICFFGEVWIRDLGDAKFGIVLTKRLPGTEICLFKFSMLLTEYCIKVQ